MAVNTVIKRIFAGSTLIVALFVLLLMSLYLMSDATHNSERFGQIYSLLLGINAFGLLLLSALVVANIITLVRQHREKAVGARMTSRLVVMFIILSVVPVLVVYSFSLQSIQRGAGGYEGDAAVA